MKRPSRDLLICQTVLVMASLLLAGCGNANNDPNSGAPPPLKVEHVEDSNLFKVEHPEQFPATPAVEHVATSELTATGIRSIAFLPRGIHPLAVFAV